MAKNGNQITSVSALMGVAVSDASGRTLGHVREFAVYPPADANHVQALVLKPAGGNSKQCLVAPVSDLDPNVNSGLRLRHGTVPGPLEREENYLLLERDLLDQQIIDVHGHKVVRVNDVELVWEPTHSGNGTYTGNGHGDSAALALRIAEVEVGVRGAVRRLLKGLPASTVDRIANQFRTTVIPWEFVDLIERDPARRVKLKIEQDRLAKMHPSDLADILEELAPAERQALFTSLDEGTAAETLEEVEPRMQKALTESLDSEKIADIVEEMDPAAAADFLAELPEERSEAILEEMEPEERQDVEDLLEYEDDTAAGEMTRHYIALSPTAQVGVALAAIREFEGDVEAISHIFLVDENEVLVGVVPLVKILLASSVTDLEKLKDDHIVSCDIHTSTRKVAELFDKYNLRALPVVDEEKKLAGVIYAEQVIARLRTQV